MAQLLSIEVLNHDRDHNFQQVIPALEIHLKWKEGRPFTSFLKKDPINKLIAHIALEED